MPTIIHTLEEDGEHGERLHGMSRGHFLDGECYAFATALHQGLGWKMLGLRQGDTIRHVVVTNTRGKYFDARGFISEEELGTPFGLVPPHDLYEVTENDLGRDGETIEARECSVRIARQIAEALWPKLPWKESFASRASAFADDLETLSRKHRIWIMPPVPASPPVLAESFDREGGYELRPTEGAFSFTIDRWFTE